MGRAVMVVGRETTGAEVLLVLSILIVLTAENCRAQKGWFSPATPNWQPWYSRAHSVSTSHGHAGLELTL